MVKKIVITLIVVMSMGCLGEGGPTIPQDRIEPIQEEKILASLPYTAWSIHFNETTDTESMRPTIGKGSTLFLIDYKNAREIKSLEEGDIIQFEIKGIYITHRIVEIGTDNKGKYYKTKGDNNRFNDGKIREYQIKRVVVGVLY